LIDLYSDSSKSTYFKLGTCRYLMRWGVPSDHLFTPTMNTRIGGKVSACGLSSFGNQYCEDAIGDLGKSAPQIRPSENVV